MARPAFYLLGAPLAVLLAFGLVATVFALLGEPTYAFIAGLCGLLLPAIPIFVARALLLRGFLRLRQARAANVRGDVASAIRDAEQILRTVFRADVRACAIYELGSASAQAGDHAAAADLFLRALATIPSGLKTAEVRRVTAIACARAAMHATWAHERERAHELLERADASRALFRGGFSANAMPSGALRLDAVLAEIEGRRAPEPYVHLGRIVLASATGDHTTARAILEREGPALTQLLGPRDRKTLDEVAETYRALGH